MSFQRTRDRVVQRMERDPEALSTGKFKRGNKIAVAGHHHEDPDQPSKREPRDVKANTQIHSLLLNVRDQVLCSESTRLLRQTPQRRLLKFPPVGHRLAGPQGEIGT